LAEYLKIHSQELDLVGPLVNDHQAEMMLHAIGADHRKARNYKGRLFYQAYRNYYDAGGNDVEQWDDLVSKGLADKNGCYCVSPHGLTVLEHMTGRSVIYDDYANYADCRNAVLTEFLKDSVYCGHGCWLPTPATTIAKRLHIPLALAREACRNLADEGYIVKGHYGELSDYDWMVYCYHGYFVTDKAKELDEWKELWAAEVDLINNEVNHDKDVEVVIGG